jgi:hypothetical protein
LRHGATIKTCHTLRATIALVSQRLTALTRDITGCRRDYRPALARCGSVTRAACIIVLAVSASYARAGAQRADWHLVTDDTQARELFREAAALSWDEHLFGDGSGPGDCRLQIATRRVPDIDGDGRADLLVQLDWVILINGADCAALASRPLDQWPARAVVLFASRGGSHPVSVVASAVEDGQTAGRVEVVRFVRLARARIGVEVLRTIGDPETGCERQTTQVWMLARDSVRLVSSREQLAC